MAFNRFFKSNPARMLAASPSMSSPSPMAPTTPPAPSTGPRKRPHVEEEPEPLQPRARTVRQKLFAGGDTDRST
jgi:hypothetical protein